MPELITPRSLKYFDIAAPIMLFLHVEGQNYLRMATDIRRINFVYSILIQDFLN